MPQLGLRSLALASGLLLTACGLEDEWFGTPEDPPLPGERIAILDLDRTLAPDPAISDRRVVLPEPFANPAWPQAGGPPEHAAYHLALSDSPQPVWRVDIGEGSDDDARILTQPVVADGLVYTLDAVSTVSAFDVDSGELRWRVDLEPEDEDDGYFGGGIAHAEGRLFVTTGFARVFALSASDGEVIWDVRLPTPLRAAPTVADGRVFVLSLDNRLEALSVEDGRQLWVHSSIQEATGLVGAASPAVSGYVVVAPFSSGDLIALQAQNGRVLWNESLASLRRFDQVDNIAHIRGLPVIDRGLVIAIGNSGRMAAIDLRRGLRAWELDLGGTETPWAAGDFIFVVSSTGQVVCLARNSGRVRWVQNLPRFEDPEDQDDPIFWRGPVLAGERLIVAGSNGQMLMLSPFDGEILSQTMLDDAVAVSPVVAGGTLFVLTENATLQALR
jgi:outer membrane protein assembly factor BamB